MISGRQRQLYEFGPFRLDVSDRSLVRDGEALPLTPKVFDLLLVLVENHHRTLTKGELLDHIWPGAFVEENSLSRNISILRKTLAAGANGDGYIKTVPKLGYRFDAEVRAVVEDEDELVVERRTRYSVQLQGDHSQPMAMTTWTGTRIYVALACIAAIGLLGFAVLVGSSNAWRSGADASAIASADPTAVDLYRRGRDFWRNRSAAGLHQSILLLEQAVERDPDFALGHAALADAYAFDTRHWPKAEATARRAIELDPKLGNPYATIGFVRLFWEWKTRDAEAEFRKAITLSPEYATAHQWYAINLAIVGHFNEASEEIARALELEPNDVAVNADMCQMLYILQRYDEAEAQCKKTLRLDPMSFNTYSLLYYIYTAEQRYQDAVSTYMARDRLAVNLAPNPEFAQSLQDAFDQGGIGGYWRRRLDYLRMPGGSAYELARYHALLGENDAAILELERACRTREFGFIFFFSEPMFRHLVDDPRYEELAASLIEDRLPTTCGS